MSRCSLAAAGSAGLFLIGVLLSCASSARAFSDEANSAPPERAWTVPTNDVIRRLLAERVQHNGVGPVVVGVIEPAGRRVVAYGRSGASDERPLDGDSVFQVGSVTKVFTTLGLPDMLRRGELKLGDPASKYLPPGVAMPERGLPITLGDLATHMSGLPPMPTNYEPQGEPNPYEACTLEHLYDCLASPAWSASRAPRGSIPISASPSSAICSPDMPGWSTSNSCLYDDREQAEHVVKERETLLWRVGTSTST